MRRLRKEPLALLLISGWEFFALLTRKIPTVTHMVMRLPRPMRVVVIGATGWWLVDHFELFD